MFLFVVIVTVIGRETARSLNQASERTK